MSWDRNANDRRLFSTSAARNREVIAKTLAEILPRNARVLDIASGTGEHGIAVCHMRPDLTWQFSDIDEDARASQAAWTAHEGLNLPEPLALDMAQSDWTLDLRQQDAMFCANMIHIAPIEALQGLAKGAAKVIKTDGIVVLYGPFLFDAATAPSNLAFDANLKARNPAWGVRSLDLVKHIFAQDGFTLTEMRALPKNNHILVFTRR